MCMELQLGLAPPGSDTWSRPLLKLGLYEDINVNSKKRGFDHGYLEDEFSAASFKNYEKGLVGWPPVKTWRRKKLRCQVHNHMTAAENGCCGGRASNSTYVKVKMEGVVIARKIDISIHQSFETLTTTLMTMFDIFDENRRSFKLTYQDKEGDWLIAEDVPWRTFVRSLKCLKLIRSKGYQLGSTSNYKISSAMFLLP
ncbi:Auxin-responsive IAA9 [Gossypium arboreum]|uniref:Auxin-responsive protein n=1 Tax=Gossypium arboreum TaxID=29729 RepID=A0A0B0MQZ7_GOSAR|nr:auxin-responsive protein IAA20-like isoform X1 [Gossypium arboreum]XP_017644061.1 auxin-responsive protein IAA20-like isoform X1 [Gossypium arboreum]KHG04553.1 Auxin-responsive IAA9 [Gossypium arboreum]